MFYVDRESLPRHYIALTGNVQESIGDPTNVNCYTTYAEAYAESQRLLRLKQEKDVIYHNRYSNLVLFIYRMRAMFNSKIRGALKEYYQRRDELQALLESPAVVKIAWLPDSIPVQGDRLTVGQAIWEIQENTFELAQTEVISESIRYHLSHPTAVPAVYKLSNGRYLRSDMSSSYSQHYYFTDGKEAHRVFKTLVEAQIRALTKKIE